MSQGTDPQQVVDLVDLSYGYAHSIDHIIFDFREISQADLENYQLSGLGYTKFALQI